jgi:hypothetical protein
MAQNEVLAAPRKFLNHMIPERRNRSRLMVGAQWVADQQENRFLEHRLTVRAGIVTFSGSASIRPARHPGVG